MSCNVPATSPSAKHLCSEWSILFRKRWFRQISHNSAASVRAIARIAIIANRKSTTCFPSSHRWTLCVTPKSPIRWLKTRIFTFDVAFPFFVAGNCRHFMFNTWVEHNKSQPTNHKPSMKWAWLRHVTHFKFFVPLRYLWRLELLKLETSNLVYMLIIASPSLWTSNCPWKERGLISCMMREFSDVHTFNAVIFIG